MPNLEVDKDMMIEIFEIKEHVKKSVFAVMDNRLTAAHLASDVSALIEQLDKLEVLLIGEPLVQPVPPPAEQKQEVPQDQIPAQQPAPTEEPKPEQE
jgi:hypothetical protein